MIDPVGGVFDHYSVSAIPILILISLQLTISPGLAFLFARDYNRTHFWKVIEVEGDVYFAILIILSLCGAIVHFVYLLYSDSKILKHINKRLELEAGAANQTILGSIINFILINNNILDIGTITNEKTRLVSPENNDFIKCIEVQKIEKDGYKSLCDLSFGIEKGQIFCILGPKGSGKTTAFETISCMTSISSGAILIQGKNLSIQNKNYTTGVCLQGNTLWDNMTVEQHFKVYCTMRGLNSDQTQEMIEYLYEALSLKEHATKQISQISGGTKRKLCVALAVIQAPDLILLDEPTTGVDPIGREQIWSLLKRIAQEKKSSIIISTHYFEDAELVADKLGKTRIK